MAPKKKPILRQEDFMYELDWSEKIDDYFIELLCLESTLGNFVRDGKNTLALFSVQEVIQCKFDTFFSYKHLTKRMEMLRKRFTTFHWIMSVPGVVHNPTTNAIFAPDYVWPHIMRRCSFGYAYRHNGEPKYRELKCIFGSEPVDNPNFDEEVIVLSSDDENEKHVNEGVNAEAFEAVAQLENAGHDVGNDVIQISSGISNSIELNAKDCLMYVSDSEGSRGTEVSTSNSKVVTPNTIGRNNILRSKAANIKKFNPSNTPTSSTASNRPYLVFVTPKK